MTEPVPGVLIHDEETFVRMTLAERWQHLLLAASFAILLVTGLPVLLGLGAGPAWRALLHRGAALVLIGDLIWHVLYTVLTERGRRNFRDKMQRKPGLALESSLGLIQLVDIFGKADRMSTLSDGAPTARTAAPRCRPVPYSAPATTAIAPP